jgi:hypothetical protein
MNSTFSISFFMSSLHITGSCYIHAWLERLFLYSFVKTKCLNWIVAAQLLLSARGKKMFCAVGLWGWLVVGCMGATSVVRVENMRVSLWTHLFSRWEIMSYPPFISFLSTHGTSWVIPVMELQLGFYLQEAGWGLGFIHFPLLLAVEQSSNCNGGSFCPPLLREPIAMYGGSMSYPWTNTKRVVILWTD